MCVPADDVTWHYCAQFYAPWCRICKEMDPTWHRIGSELKSVGSPVNVGKCDAIANAEFKVRTYPAIFMWKNDMKYLYLGPRTADAIVEFANRVSGPLIRPLTSLELFQHTLSRHDVMFVYIGASSLLKSEYSSVAQEMIVSTFFFSASRDVVPKAVSLPALPAVVVFKDGAYFSYNGQSRSRFHRERHRDRIFFLYYSPRLGRHGILSVGVGLDGSENDNALFCAGKLILLALLDDANVSQQNLKYDLRSVRCGFAFHSHRNIHFGFMEGNEYINGLIMGELQLPTIVMLNLSTDSYFLPPAPLETERHLLDFVDQVLDGRIQAHGGNGVIQRVRRFIYDTKGMLLSVFVSIQPLLSEAPLLGCFLLGFPLGLLVFLCFVCWKAKSDYGTQDDDDDDDDNRPIFSRRQIPDKKSD
uniref:protein disulfide-isomerase n=1 Tax=Hippocampus comes TaxID=109280 RepID=A0A3Q2ZD32_HIPCM